MHQPSRQTSRHKDKQTDWQTRKHLKLLNSCRIRTKFLVSSPIVLHFGRSIAAELKRINRIIVIRQVCSRPRAFALIER